MAELTKKEEMPTDIQADANLITIMREEQETDFTASRNMRQILSTCPMPLLVIPNKNAFSVGR